MKQLLSRLRGAAPVVARDATGIAGCGLVIAGLAMIYVPIATIVAGVLLIGGAYLAARGG